MLGVRAGVSRYLQGYRAVGTVGPGAGEARFACCWTLARHAGGLVAGREAAFLWGGAELRWGHAETRPQRENTPSHTYI